ncbi:PTB-containing, cubilin and LRP1-interacting protein-like [Physella acuta]|uniref:PTB-containing, cubilin and LRP1-interacting protein-like n=1 Tax=Physella acuta TaxID=109671 RepID=UPI0027DE16A1|nr:PTB-containing, cubilin and LRP1-interacting protein-like [Physella acuta]
MFSWKKDSAHISDEEPNFHVRYLGHTETYVPSGKGCTLQPLKRLWDSAPTERSLRRVVIKLGLNGLFLQDLEKKESKNITRNFDMENISFCAADRSVNDRLFCWIYKNPETEKLEAHAVLCNTSDKPKIMVVVLSRAFYLAYKDWRAEKKREERRKIYTLRNFSGEESPHTSGSHLPSPNHHKSQTTQNKTARH